MADLTRSGAPVGAGNSKIRRKQLEIWHLDLGIEQREIEILEKEEEIVRMQAQQQKLKDELTILEEQLNNRP